MTCDLDEVHELNLLCAFILEAGVVSNPVSTSLFEEGTKQQLYYNADLHMTLHRPLISSLKPVVPSPVLHIHTRTHTVNIVPKVYRGDLSFPVLLSDH